MPGREIHIQCYSDQLGEAAGVAEVCKRLIERQGVEPSQILILIRSDHQRKVSSTVLDALRRAGVPVAERTEEGPLDSQHGRLVLAYLRLLCDATDSLAWRTVLQLETNRIGPDTLKAIREFAQNQATRFALALRTIRENPAMLPRFGQRVVKQICYVEDRLSKLADCELTLPETIRKLTTELIKDSPVRETVADYLETIAAETVSNSLSDLLQALSASLDRAEQELVPGAVNILTMHKAKGLSADTVIIVGAEDEFIPGRNLGVSEGDERRLLYVSMTRAKHRLWITYCQKRTGRQQYTGRNSGKQDRNLTRFLHDAPIQVEHMS